MENENTNPFENPVSKSEFSGFWIPSHNAKVMKAGLDKNKAPFLPDHNGNIKAEPVYTLSQGYCLPASRLVLMNADASRTTEYAALCTEFYL